MTALASSPRSAVTRRTTATVDRRLRIGATTLLAGSLVLVTAWWIGDGGLRDLGLLRGPATGATFWTGVGRVTGLWASVLLLAQVVLMARIPLLERAFGQDRVARLHRVVGFTSFDLMAVHVVTIAYGYSGASLGSFVPTTWDLTTSYAGMLLAVAGTAALVMVVVTSVRAARRRLRYESWHLLHLYAYLGVGLALPHQLWTGAQFMDSPARTAFWWTAWALAAAAVVCFRLGQPVLLNLRHQLRVSSIVDEGDGVRSIYVKGRDLHTLRAEAGQFFTWRFLDGVGWSRGHPYSLSAAPDGTRLRITVQDAGDGSRRTRDLRPGTRVLVEGPFGRLTQRPRTRDKVAFIGAGVGTTPLRALAEGLDYAPGDAIWLERHRSLPLFEREMDTLGAERGIAMLRLPGPRRAPDSWLCEGMGPFDDLAALRAWIPDVRERDVYVCGPAAWTELVVRTLHAAGVPDRQLHLETFAW